MKYFKGERLNEAGYERIYMPLRKIRR